MYTFRYYMLRRYTFNIYMIHSDVIFNKITHSVRHFPFCTLYVIRLHTVRESFSLLLFLITVPLLCFVYTFLTFILIILSLIRFSLTFLILSSTPLVLTLFLAVKPLFWLSFFLIFFPFACVSLFLTLLVIPLILLTFCSYLKGIVSRDWEQI